VKTAALSGTRMHRLSRTSPTVAVEPWLIPGREPWPMQARLLTLVAKKWPTLENLMKAVVEAAGAADNLKSSPRKTFSV
jgi:hypothetical protein